MSGTTNTTIAGVPGRITIVIGKGDDARSAWEIDADIYGQLAVHLDTRVPRPAEDPEGIYFALGRFGVTHVRTGRLVASSLYRDACEAFAARWGEHEVWRDIAGPVSGSILPGDLWVAIHRLGKGYRG